LCQYYIALWDDIGTSYFSRSLVIDDFLNDGETDAALAPIVYFYCARDAAESERADPSALFRTIVRQLSCPRPGLPVHKSVMKKYDNLTDQGAQTKQLNLDECAKLIIEVYETLTSVTIVIDAMDECNSVVDVFEQLESIWRQSMTPIRVFMSSRDEKQISIRVKDAPNFSADSAISIEENLKDIGRFVVHEVDRAISRKSLLLGVVSEDLKQLIIQTLTDGAQGM
jgi:uncharacterized protein YqfB (UPF0267 family)